MSEKRFRALIENSIDGIALTDEHGKTTYVSPAITKILGYPADELDGRDIFELPHPDDLTRVREIFERLARKPNMQETIELRVRHHDGSWRWFTTTVTNLLDEPAVGNIVINFRDITERYLAMEKLCQQARQQAAVAELGQQALTADDLQGLMDKAAAMAADTLDIEYAKVLECLPDNKHLLLRAGVGWKPGLVGHATVATEKESQAGYTLLTDKPVVVTDFAEEKRFVPPPLLTDHEVISGISISIPGKERPWGVFGAHTTRQRQFTPEEIYFITAIANILGSAIERHRTAKSLQENEQQFRSLFENAPIGIGVVDLSGKILTYNDAMLKPGGYTREDVDAIGDISDLYYDPRQRETVLTLLAEQGFVNNYPVRLKAKDGAPYDILLTLTPIHFKGQSCIQALVEDVTAREQAEAQLRLQATALESTADTIVITDRDGVIEWVNPAFTAQTGYTPQEAIGQTPRILKSDKHSPEFFVKLWETILSGKPFTAEFTNKRKDGSLYHETKTITPILDAQGEITHFVATGKDVTERKRAEAKIERQKQEMLRLYRASDTLLSSTTPDLDELSQVIVKTVSKEFGTANCSLLLVQQDSKELARTAAIGPYAEEVSKGQVRLDGPGVAPRAIRTGQIVNIGDVANAPDYVANWEAARSELVIPLKIGTKVIGAIDVQSTEANAFSKNDQHLMSVFAERAALALENARLYAETQRRIRSLETLFALSAHLRTAQTIEEILPLLLRDVRKALNLDDGLVVLLEPDSEHFTIALADGHFAPNTGRTFNIKEGISGQVLRSRQPYVTDDYAADPHRLAGLYHTDEIGPTALVPLQSEQALLGVLMASRHRGPQVEPFSPDEVRLLSTIGEMAGNSLRRIGLYEHAVTRLKRVQALRNVDMAITGSLDPRLTLRILLDEVTTQLKIDAASVLLLNPHTQVLEYAAGRGFITKSIERSRLRLGEGYAGRAALERRVLNITDFSQAEDSVRKQVLRDDNFVAYCAVPMIAKGRVLGVLETFHRTRLTTDGEWVDFLEALAGQAAIAVENAQLFHDMEQSNVELRMAYDATIEGWSRAMDLRDRETEGHTRRVTELTLRLAQVMGLRDEQLVHMRRGALLHDMGKLGVPDHILLKPDKLTDEEWVIMRSHPQYAYEMLSPIEYLRPALEIPYCHHEKWDGTGYPQGLQGEEIPLAARIFAVVDAWDALRSDRPYRDAWPEEKVLAYIREGAGNHFDPQVVETFLTIIADEESMS
ncbi:MAG: PAS domain S-box protein [Chloroflexi bacterium]|nr:PAS domain S-box protein [Chloroflexota bacterium]